MANHPSELKNHNADEYRSRQEISEDGGYRKSLVVKRSILVGRHKTSISLEEPFWNALRTIARERNLALSQLVGSIDSERLHNNLSSAIRLFVFERYRSH
jgi:predicted DNA-binding ribbon-helix-helix protein